MLITHLHFNGDCADAIALYEKAFNTKAFDYDYGNNGIAHARMIIHGQTVWLNDAKDHMRNEFGIDGAAHLVVTFDTPEELLACHEIMAAGENVPCPFAETPYSKMAGNFKDKYGVLWGFIIV